MQRNTTVGVILIFACVLVGLADEPRTGSGLIATKTDLALHSVDTLVPATATWSARWDHTLDGAVVSNSPWELQLDVRNDSITGHVSKDPDGHSSGSIFSGQLIRHKPQAPRANAAVLVLREDHADGYFVISTARMVSAKRFLGTWVDNAGQIGDFEIKIME